MEDHINRLKAHFDTQSIPQSLDKMNFQQIAADQVRSFGPNLDQNQVQLATVMASIQLKSEHENKLSMHLLQKSILETINTVTGNKQEIAKLQTSVQQAFVNCSDLTKSYQQLLQKVNEAHAMSFKANTLAAEIKQKNSKGNFIISGEHVPKQTANENWRHSTFYIQTQQC